MSSSRSKQSFSYLVNRKRMRSDNRYEFPLVPSHTAIIVIDLQQEFEIDNEYYKATFPPTLGHINDICASARLAGAEVIFTYIEALTNDSRDMSLDYKMSGPSFTNIPGPRNKAKFLPGLYCSENDILIPKTSCSVFNSTNIDYVLRNLGIHQVVIVGQLSDQCCESAVRDAADLGYLVTVVKDACIAKSTNEHEKGINAMKGFARILSTFDVVEELRLHLDITAPNETLVESISDPIIDKLEEMDVENLCNFPLTVSLEHWKPPSHDKGLTQALYHALDFAGIKFIRIGAIDIGGNIRTKAVPLKRLILGQSNINEAVTMAKVVIGMPSYADCILTSTKLTAEDVLPIHVDFNTLKILPYSTSSCCVLGNLYEQRSDTVSKLCSRAYLGRVIDAARMNFQIEFDVGAELEFCLYRSDAPVDHSLFANPVLLDEQESFISGLYDQLQSQKIDVELIHSESASGQLELVLAHMNDPLRIADNIIFARETIRAYAQTHGMSAHFEPKLRAKEAGNGLHLHFSILNLDEQRQNIFSSNDKTTISEKGKSFLEGILLHLPALTALTTPSINSFERVGPGCWTGSTATWAIEDKESPLRVCLTNTLGHVSNLEYKLFDFKANPYLGIGAIIVAGLDGIRNNLTLRPSKDPYSKPLPKSFHESLSVLKEDKIIMESMGDELSTVYLGMKTSENDHFQD